MMYGTKCDMHYSECGKGICEKFFVFFKFPHKNILTTKKRGLRYVEN